MTKYWAPEEEKPHAITCRKCQDTGFCFVEDDNLTVLMRCICESGESAQAEYIPRFNKSLVHVYPAVDFPVASFNPRISKDDGDKSITDKIWNQVEFWNAKKQLNEDYWKEQILKADHSRKDVYG